MSRTKASVTFFKDVKCALPSTAIVTLERKDDLAFVRACGSVGFETVVGSAAMSQIRLKVKNWETLPSLLWHNPTASNVVGFWGSSAALKSLLDSWTPNLTIFAYTRNAPIQCIPWVEFLKD